MTTSTDQPYKSREERFLETQKSLFLALLFGEPIDPKDYILTTSIEDFEYEYGDSIINGDAPDTANNS